MTKREAHTLFVLWSVASVARLGIGRTLCAHMEGPDAFNDGYLAVTIDSKQLKAHVANLRHRQPMLLLDSSIACSIYACGAIGTSAACQMQYRTKLDPLETGGLFLARPVALLPQKQLLPSAATAEQSSSFTANETAGPTRQPNDTTLNWSRRAAAAASGSMTVKVSASCRLRNSSREQQQASFTASDSMLQKPLPTVNTTGNQPPPAADRSGVVWTETVQLTLLQQKPQVTSAAAQQCPVGSTEITAWRVPRVHSLADDEYEPDNSQTSTRHSNPTVPQEPQQAAEVQHNSRDTRPYEDQYDYEQWQQGSDFEADAVFSFDMVMLDLVLPEVEDWFLDDSSSSNNSSSGSGILAQQDTAASASSAAPATAAAVGVAAESGRTSAVRLWLGRLLLVGTLIGIQLGWQHLYHSRVG